MSTDTDRVNYRTETTMLPGSIESGRAGIRFLRIVQFVHPASPLTIVQYQLNGVEQADGLRLDLDKFAFLDHYAGEANIETERGAARQIVEYLANRASHSQASGRASSAD